MHNFHHYSILKRSHTTLWFASRCTPDIANLASSCLKFPLNGWGQTSTVVCEQPLCTSLYTVVCVRGIMVVGSSSSRSSSFGGRDQELGRSKPPSHIGVKYAQSHRTCNILGSCEPYDPSGCIWKCIQRYQEVSRNLKQPFFVFIIFCLSFFFFPTDRVCYILWHCKKGNECSILPISLNDNICFHICQKQNKKQINTEIQHTASAKEMQFCCITYCM